MSKEAGMSLKGLNEDVRNLAAGASGSVVEVRARRGAPSSGVAWSADGLVVTAEHTLEEEEGIEIATAGGKELRAELAGRDPSTGIALLRTQGAALTPPRWRDSGTLVTGEMALLAAASRLGPRVSLTTVSVVGEPWHTDNGGRIDRYVETDARLFPGFSGSLVLDWEGKALGLNTAGLRRRTPIVIPGETLARVVKVLAERGTVRRGYLGITTYPVRLPDTVKTQKAGLLVLSVQGGSPAASAGLFLGDVILAVEGQIVESPTALLSQLTEERVGTRLEARILRAGKEEKVALTVAPRA
jgi:S1-C subfamily serine protease